MTWLDHLGINSVYFGILLTILPFMLGQYLFKKTNETKTSKRNRGALI